MTHSERVKSLTEVTSEDQNQILPKRCELNDHRREKEPENREICE